jgi:serine/threonine protein kinase
VAAVAYLHAENVVHRDLKDSNILFRNGEPMVADFGIARDLKVEPSITVGMGTPGWEAPEQRSAKPAKVAATMDVWALGKLLVYLYTQDVNKVDADPEKLPVEIPNALHGIISKCLASRPRGRYANAQELEKALPSSLRTTRARRR